MTRLARVIAVDVPHHVTQRDNGRRFILNSDADRMAYLHLLRQNIELHGVGLIGHCLMSNHVHLVVTPHHGDGLALALRRAHGRYAIYWNAVHQSSGHAWQGRYYSCPLDRVHLREALRYTELNPVRAGLRARRKRGCGPAQRHTAEPNRGTRNWIWSYGGKLDCRCLVAVPSGWRDGIQADGDSPMHPHRATAG